MILPYVSSLHPYQNQVHGFISFLNASPPHGRCLSSSFSPKLYSILRYALDFTQPQYSPNSLSPSITSQDPPSLISPQHSLSFQLHRSYMTSCAQLSGHLPPINLSLPVPFYPSTHCLHSEHESDKTIANFNLRRSGGSQLWKEIAGSVLRFPSP